MNLAEKMRQKAIEGFDDVLYENFKCFAIKQIENVASYTRHTEIYTGTGYDAKFCDKTGYFLSVNECEVYWEKLKDDLKAEGFKVTMGHYLGPYKYGYELEVSW